MNAPCSGNDPLLSVDVTDAYLAAWLLMNGCALVECICRPNAGPLGCLIVFSAPRIHELEEQYFARRVQVDLWEFRVAFNRINQHVHEAKRSYPQAQCGEAAEGGVS
jgi:hypothetical protein